MFRIAARAECFAPTVTEVPKRYHRLLRCPRWAHCDVSGGEGIVMLDRHGADLLSYCVLMHPEMLSKRPREYHITRSL